MKTEQYKNKELVVRKQMAGFLEKLFRHAGYDFRHDLFKNVVYGEKEHNTPLEETFKNYFDAYSYLLSNGKNPFTIELLKKFFYLLNGNETDESLLVRTTTYFFKHCELPALERAIDFHLYVYNELMAMEQNNALIISLMMFNYVLVKAGIPSIQIYIRALEEYEQLRDKYFMGDKEPLYKFMLEQVTKADFLDKSYVKSLTPITVKEVYDKLIKEQDVLKYHFRVQGLYVFGSIVKETQRFDSDIDLLVVLPLDVSFERRSELTTELSDYLYSVLNRKIDIIEISEYIAENTLKYITNYTKIY